MLIHILSEGYFGDLVMLACIRDVRRREIRHGMSSVENNTMKPS